MGYRGRCALLFIKTLWWIMTYGKFTSRPSRAGPEWRNIQRACSLFPRPLSTLVKKKHKSGSLFFFGDHYTSSFLITLGGAISTLWWYCPGGLVPKEFTQIIILWFEFFSWMQNLILFFGVWIWRVKISALLRILYFILNKKESSLILPTQIGIFNFANMCYIKYLQ